MDDSGNAKPKTAARAAWTARRTAQLLAALSGYVLIAFAVGGRPGGVGMSVCILAFLAGGIRVGIGAAGREREVQADAGGAVALGAALAYGPVAAAFPAAMAALGEILLPPGEREPFHRSVYRIGRLPAQAAVAGLAFMAAGGDPTAPAALSSLVSALAAAAAYALADALLGPRTASAYGLSTTLGLGYALAGALRALPGFTVLLPTLPLALVLLSQLRRARISAAPAVGQEEIQRPSLLDPLTGLANQRYLQMFLQQEISRSERSGQPLTVLLIDMDDFDRLNSAHGTDAGDRSMAALASALKSMVRDYDLVARHKDDEFIMVLPETDADAGSETARRLHSALSGQILPLCARFSVGVATYPFHGESVDDLLSSAHHALNRAKFSGKNNVLSCHELAKAS